MTVARVVCAFLVAACGLACNVESDDGDTFGSSGPSTATTPTTTGTDTTGTTTGEATSSTEATGPGTTGPTETGATSTGDESTGGACMDGDTQCLGQDATELCQNGSWQQMSCIDYCLFELGCTEFGFCLAGMCECSMC